MKLSGEAILHAGAEAVYTALNDPAVLVRTIPGCQRLELVAPAAYRATIIAGVASIKGTFDGNVRLTDQVVARSFTLHASGVGAPGTVDAIARVTLEAVDSDTTRLTYDADATIGGVIGGVGQRMITAVARKTAAEFFTAVDQAINGVPVEAPGPIVLPPPAGVAVPAGVPAQAGAPAAGVWTAAVPVLDAARQRTRDLLVGAVFGAVVALLGVLVGAIVAGW